VHQVGDKNKFTKSVVFVVVIVVAITTIIVALYFLSTNEIESMTKLFVQKEFVTILTFKKESVFIVCTIFMQSFVKL
jgi:hypothetical protein